MAINLGNWGTGVESVSTMCRRWVNPDVTDEAELKLQSRLIGFLFCVPLFSVLYLGANLPAQLNANLIVPMLALAFAMPVIAAAIVSISGSLRVRNLVIAFAAPVAFLSITGGRVGLAPVFYLALAIAVFEASRSQTARRAWTISAAILCFTALIVSFSAPFGATVQSSFAGLAPVVLAAIGYVIASPPKQLVVDTHAVTPTFEFADDLVAPTGALVVQISRNGLVAAVGANARSLLDLDQAELFGKHLVDRIHLADRVAFLSWLDALPAAQSWEPITFRIKSGRVDGQGAPSWVQVGANPKVINDAILLTAVHSNKQREEAPSSVPVSLDNAALAVVSHELRTPLNAIVGFSDMLKQEMFGPLENDRQREYIELVHQSGLHLLGVVNAMLDWSRIENGNLELHGSTFAPAEAAAFAVGIVSNAAMTKSIGLDFLPNSALDEFSGDQRVCQQILINLLANAVKFTPEKGMVSLMVDVDAERMLIVVEDTGIGMTREQQSRAGTPYYQADGGNARAHEGTGLGLALVMQMAKLHGGSVEINSEPGHGTKVTVALASIHAKGANVTSLHKAGEDESVRIIRVFEERDHGTQRKTA